MTKTIIIAIITALIGYFLGIHKERSNIKWKEKRDALKETYTYLQNLSQALMIDNVFNKDFAEKTEGFFGKISPILPLKFNTQLKNLIVLVEKYIIRMGLVNDINKQEILKEAYKLMENIEKELK